MSGDIEMPFGPHGMLQGELHQPFPGQMRSMRPGMGMVPPQPGMRPPPHMMTPGHYVVPHRQMPPYSEVPRPEVKMFFKNVLLCQLVQSHDTHMDPFYHFSKLSWWSSKVCKEVFGDCWSVVLLA